MCYERVNWLHLLMEKTEKHQIYMSKLLLYLLYILLLMQIKKWKIDCRGLGDQRKTGNIMKLYSFSLRFYAFNSFVKLFFMEGQNMQSTGCVKSQKVEKGKKFHACCIKAYFTIQNSEVLIKESYVSYSNTTPQLEYSTGPKLRFDMAIFKTFQNLQLNIVTLQNILENIFQVRRCQWKL